MSFIARGFRGRRRADAPAERVPPGQYVTSDFPVLSAGPTPRVSLEDWRFTLTDTTGSEKSWSWNEFRELPAEDSSLVELGHEPHHVKTERLGPTGGVR